MFWIILFLLTGLLLLIIGGNIFVDSAAWLAEKTGIPKVIVGATIVSIATTMPEMIVSFVAASEGKTDIAIGNAIGSATVNISFIMALTLIFIPIAVRQGEITVKAFCMLMSVLIILLFGITGQLGIVPGVILLLCFILFMADNILSGIRALKLENHSTGFAPDLMINSDDAAKKKQPVKNGLTVNLLKFTAGAVCIVAGSRLLVTNGSLLAGAMGVSERVIAVSIIAVGTSLPELITAISAIAKKQSDLSVGNIIGANIVNLAFVQPVCILLAGKPLPVTVNLAYVDIPVCLVISCLAFIPLLWKKKSYRFQGILLICIYISYLIYTVRI